MPNTITISKNQYDALVGRIDKLEKLVKSLISKTKESRYGSDEWWEKENKEAIKEFKAGKGIQFNSAKDAIKWLNS